MVNNEIKSEKFRKLLVAALVTGILSISFGFLYNFLWKPIADLLQKSVDVSIMPFIVLPGVGIAIGLAIAEVVCGSIDLKRIKTGIFSRKGKGFDDSFAKIRFLKFYICLDNKVTGRIYMESEENLVKTCIDAGAYKAYVITTDKIPFDENLMSYCEVNYCGNYGKNYACPPGVGNSKELIVKAKKYKKALVFQTVTQIEDSFDFEGMKEAQFRHSKIADKINEHIKKQFDGYLQLTAGECSVCQVCAQVENEPCRFPEKAISSLEAYCMNVSTLAELCNMKYINGQNTVTYFGAFLFN